MRTWRGGRKTLLLGAVLLCGSPSFFSNAQAALIRHTRSYPPVLSYPALLPAQAGLVHIASTRVIVSNRFHANRRAMYGGHRGKLLASRSQGISCVPYAREASGILIPGNAWQWWDNAAGVYARGDRPAVGSVLNFRSNSRMPLGHVAVVDRVINAREILVEHANWPSFGVGGQIIRGVTIVDVSEANNWSAVRVELGRGTEFGSVYPTYGFIYNRPDPGVITASVIRPAPQPDINPVPSDLRPKAERPWHIVEEVAEFPTTGPKRIDPQAMTVSDAR